MSQRLLTRTMWAWGFRYEVIGSCIGLKLPFFMSQTIEGLVFNLAVMSIYGVVVGAVLGGIAGALNHWMKLKVGEVSDKTK